MIAQTLLAALRTHFPNRELQLGTPPEPVITLPAQHPSVGNISLWDDGDEVTLEIGDITHGHFARYDASNPDERAQALSEQVIAFLDLLFADQVVLWKACSGSGGWQVLDAAHPFTYQVPADTQFFLWSGPKTLDEIVARTSAHGPA